MTRVRIDDSLSMYYDIDDFTEPWRPSETLILLHGIAENSAVWYEWVPRLADKYAVLRVDLRGWGKSSKPGDGYEWSTSNFAKDVKVLLDRLKLQKVHMVGAKTGGTIGIQFAHDYPERLNSLALIGAPVSWKHRPAGQDHGKTVREKGLEYWARETMTKRLGDVPQNMINWWIKLFTQNSARVASEILSYFRTVDLSDILEKINVPTLMVVGESEALAPAQTFRKWQQAIPNSELVVIASKAYHLAAVNPDECCRVLLNFLKRIS